MREQKRCFLLCLAGLALLGGLLSLATAAAVLSGKIEQRKMPTRIGAARAFAADVDAAAAAVAPPPPAAAAAAAAADDAKTCAADVLSVGSNPRHSCLHLLPRVRLLHYETAAAARWRRFDYALRIPASELPEGSVFTNPSVLCHGGQLLVAGRLMSLETEDDCCI